MCVIEEKSGLSCGFLLESDGRTLGLSRWGEFEGADLATMEELADGRIDSRSRINLPEGEEVLDLLLTGGRTDVLNVDCAGRHDVDCCLLVRLIRLICSRIIQVEFLKKESVWEGRFSFVRR